MALWSLLARTSPHLRLPAGHSLPSIPQPVAPSPCDEWGGGAEPGLGPSRKRLRRPSCHTAASLSDQRSKWTGQDSLPEGHCYLQERLLMALGMWSPASVIVLLTAHRPASAGREFRAAVYHSRLTAADGASGPERWLWDLGGVAITV